MPRHDLHKGDPRQVLSDGCGLCERRSREPHLAIEPLSTAEFPAAWARAAEWHRHGGAKLGLSRAEMPVLRFLWAIEVQMEKRGFQVGSCPVEL
jgi:hypothetical protein